MKDELSNSVVYEGKAVQWGIQVEPHRLGAY
jgi:hypothetical protein